MPESRTPVDHRGIVPTFFLSGFECSTFLWKDQGRRDLAHGVCLFPAVDMPDWHTGHWLHNGLCDLLDEGGTLHRVPAQRYVDELHRWQRLSNRVTEVVQAAQRMKLQPDRNWS
jgi:hypothetical protein